jgi:hypothetical protein
MPICFGVAGSCSLGIISTGFQVMEKSSSTRTIARVVLVAAPALLALWMLWRFLPALTWAAVLAISTWPVRQWAIRRGWTTTAAAAALTASIGLLIVVPLIISLSLAPGRPPSYFGGCARPASRKGTFSGWSSGHPEIHGQKAWSRPLVACIRHLQSRPTSLLRRDGCGGWPSRKSKTLQLWLVGECEQATRYGRGAGCAMQRNFSPLDGVSKSIIAEPHLGEDAQIGRDDDIDFSAGRSLQTNFDIIGAQHQPPVPWATIGLRNSAKIEANHKSCRGYFGLTDLPSHPPQEHFRIEVIGADQTLCPPLAPYAHQFNNWSKIFSGWRQSVQVPFTFGLRFDVHDAVLFELLETLRQDCS